MHYRLVSPWEETVSVYLNWTSIVHVPGLIGSYKQDVDQC